MKLFRLDLHGCSSVEYVLVVADSFDAAVEKYTLAYKNGDLKKFVGRGSEVRGMTILADENSTHQVLIV